MPADVLSGRGASSTEAHPDHVAELRDEAAAPNTPAASSPARFAPAPSAHLSDLVNLSNRLRNGLQPKHLLSESIRKGDGIGPVVALDDHSGKLMVVTLGITDVVERTGLTVSVWGSPDQIDWGAKPLLTFRQRQYCGVYSVLLNLAMHTEMRFLRVQWSMDRLGRGERIPVFGFEVFVEESGARVSSSAVA